MKLKLRFIFYYSEFSRHEPTKNQVRKNMIDPQTGALQLRDGLIVDSNLSLRRFLRSSVGLGATVAYRSLEHSIFYVSEQDQHKRLLYITLYFRCWKLEQLNISLSDLAVSKNSYDYDAEFQIHKAWLEASLGTALEGENACRYAYFSGRWGSAEVAYDPRSDTTSILIKYGKNLAQSRNSP